MSKKFQFIKQEQPKFIQQFKVRAGLKEGPTLDDKKLNPSSSVKLDDRSDNEDEEPVVVVLRHGDLTKEEASQDPKESGGKIIFRKPMKRSADPGISASTKKTKSLKSDKEINSKPTKKKHKPTNKLLSFNNDEDDG